ncbi:MAG TPA: hypothetical protein IAC28_01155 [Candidatus Aphodovivens excrementavium]|nr:hypothetical protein [Candidatus Aphodovivens excrementavium]
MAFSFPRISITVDDGNDHGTQGELGALALGFGIHLAWSYCALFKANSVFENNGDPHALSLFFIAALLAFTLLTLFTSITDQKLLRFYTDRPTMLLAVVFAVAGSLLAVAVGFFLLGSPLRAIAGVLVGIGSGLFTMLWGTAYSRYNTASIVLNTAVAVVFGILLYSLIIHVLPWPFTGIVTAVLPLFELPLLWSLTPISYALRHAVPIFNPLPIRKVTFMLRFSLPIFLFGVVLGALKSIGLTIILPSVDPTVQLIALFAGGTATIVLLVVSFSIDKRSHWDFLFRPLVPIVALTCLFLPLFHEGNELIPSLLLLVGFLCLESLMWILPGQLSQEFRLSPICMFGIGSTAIGVGTFVGTLLAEMPELTASLPYGDGSLVIVLIVSLMLAMALLPRVRDIKRLILPHSGKDDENVAAFNKEIERAHAVLRTNTHPAWRMGLDAAGAFDLIGGVQQNPATAMLQMDASAMWADPASSTSSSADMPKDEASDEERAKVRGRFRTQCEEIANRYLLSRRETEVMFLLAKGHNAAFIQEKLCISKSTAKTHISHIYRKLDIHNQQELLAMVDAGRDQ